MFTRHFLSSHSQRHFSFFVLVNSNTNHSLALISSLLREGLKLCDYVLSRIYQFYGCDERFNNKDTHYSLVHNSEKLKTTQGADSTMQTQIL